MCPTHKVKYMLGPMCISDYMQIYFLLLWKIPEEIRRWSMLSNYYRQYLPYQALCPWNLLPWKWIDLKLGSIYYVWYCTYCVFTSDINATAFMCKILQANLCVALDHVSQGPHHQLRAKKRDMEKVAFIMWHRYR